MIMIIIIIVIIIIISSSSMFLLLIIIIIIIIITEVMRSFRELRLIIRSIVSSVKVLVWAAGLALLT